MSLSAGPNTHSAPWIPSSNTNLSDQGDRVVAMPPPSQTPLANNINMEPAQPSAAAAGFQEKTTQKKPVGSGKMKPRPSATPRYAQASHCMHAADIQCRNLCTRVWCMSNPRGTSAEFTLY